MKSWGWDPHDEISVLSRRGRETRALSAMWGPREKPAICEPERKLSPKTESAGTLSLDLQHLEPWDINICGLWHSVTSAQMVYSTRSATPCGQRRCFSPNVHGLRFFVPRTSPAAFLQMSLRVRPQGWSTKASPYPGKLLFLKERLPFGEQKEPCKASTPYMRTVSENLRGKGSARRPQNIITETLTVILKKRHMYKDSSFLHPLPISCACLPGQPTHPQMPAEASARQT